MKWIEAKVAFTVNTSPLAVDLIADAFYELKVKGVVVDDPDMEPEESWAPDAVARPTTPAVTGYLPADGHWEQKRHALEERILHISRDHSIEYTISYSSIDEQDWAESWKAFFHPQKITTRIVVKPTWREYHPEPGQLIIELDPGMAFGTGTHATTMLCVQLMEEFLKPGDDVLDVGTGSGILMIAAAKLGAARLAGLDLDAMAVDVARKNLRLNKIDMSTVDLCVGDLVQGVDDTYNLVLANILADVILELLDDVVRVIRPGGLLICSGVIKMSQPAIIEKMASCGMETLAVKSEDDWVAIVGKMQ